MLRASVVVGCATAGRAFRYRLVMLPARLRLAAVDPLRIAVHPAFLVELAQLRRIDLHEHAPAVHDLRVQLDRHAVAAPDELRRGGDVAPAGTDDVIDLGPPGH